MSLVQRDRSSSRSWRTSSALVCSALAGSLLAACASSTSDDDSTTLTFFSWEPESTMATVIEAFEDANPDIDVEFSFVPPVTEYVQTLQTRLASGTAADVFQMAAENKSNLISNGSVVDLTNEPFMANIADFNKMTYADGDSIYAMSTASWGAGVFYNIELLEQAGMTEAPGTWEELLDLMAEVKATTGVEPLYDNELAQIPFSLQGLLGSAFAGQSVDEQIFSGDASFSSTWTEPVEHWFEPYDLGLISSSVVGLSDDQLRDEFANGRVAMIVTGPWSVGPIREANPDLDFAIMPLPAPEGQAAVLPGAASPGFAINSATGNLEEAKRFLEFMASADAQAIVQEFTPNFATTLDFEPTVDPVLEPLLEPVRDGHVYLAQIAWPEFQDTLTTEAVSSVQQLVLGQIDPPRVGSQLDGKLAEMQD